MYSSAFQNNLHIHTQLSDTFSVSGSNMHIMRAKQGTYKPVCNSQSKEKSKMTI